MIAEQLKFFFSIPETPFTCSPTQAMRDAGLTPGMDEWRMCNALAEMAGGRYEFPAPLRGEIWKAADMGRNRGMKALSKLRRLGLIDWHFEATESQRAFVLLWRRPARRPAATSAAASSSTRTPTRATPAAPAATIPAAADAPASGGRKPPVSSARTVGATLTGGLRPPLAEELAGDLGRGARRREFSQKSARPSCPVS
jgi:hypothetical protein